MSINDYFLMNLKRFKFIILLLIYLKYYDWLLYSMIMIFNSYFNGIMPTKIVYTYRRLQAKKWFKILTINTKNEWKKVKWW